ALSWGRARRSRAALFEKAVLDPMSRKVDLLAGFQDANRYGRHPRGRRFAFLDFDLARLETALRVGGKMKDPATAPRRAGLAPAWRAAGKTTPPATTDRGWTVEMALPWQSLAFLFDGRTLPPR